MSPAKRFINRRAQNGLNIKWIQADKTYAKRASHVIAALIWRASLHTWWFGAVLMMQGQGLLVCWFWKSGLVFYLWSSDLWLGYHLHHLLDCLLNVLGVRVALYLVDQVLGKLCILAHHIFKLRQLQDLLHNRMECFFLLLHLRLLLKPQLLQVLLLLHLQSLLLLHLLHLKQHHLVVVCLDNQNLVL